MRRVTIETGARLHFGLLSHRPQTGRHFGGAGLMIDSPGVKLTASPASHDEVLGPDFLTDRIQNTIATYRNRVSAEHQPPPCRVEIEDFIPPHQGLGSGTQLALAVGKALSLCADEGDLPATELARRVNRGARSALGIYGFEQGGFLIDGGKREREQIGTLVCRIEFPADWRILLITPATDAGLSGTDELHAFDRLAGMPEQATNRLCRLLVMELLPAIVEHKYSEAAEAIYQFGQEVGGYFEPVQGGRFASRQMAELASSLRSRGIPGVGQSSWGPTLFALQESQTAAETLAGELQNESKWDDCKIQISRPRNHGASITVT